MPTLSNFRRDLADPEQGQNSDLYQAVSPMISSDTDAALRGHDAKRTQGLKDSVRQGIVGLEYLTGVKKNQGESFYDEHPVQAVGTDLLKHSPQIGGMLAGGGILANIGRLWSNANKFRPGEMSAKGNPGVDATSSEALLYPNKAKKETYRSDITELFGEDGDGVRNKHLRNLANKGGKDKLHDYANFHESARRAKAKGGFGGVVGNWLNKHKDAGGLKGRLASAIAPDDFAHLHELAQFNNLTKAHGAVDENLMRNILQKHLGHKFEDAAGKVRVEDFVNKLNGPKYHTGLGGVARRFIGKHRAPLAIGGAVAAGGMGLHALMKAIHNQSFSKDKQKEWKRTLMQANNDFAGAERL